jgi:hypothetical protein
MMKRLPILMLMAIASLQLVSCGERDWDARLQEIVSGEGVSPEQHIQQLEEFVEEGPPVEHASEARFTIGWIYAETLHQYEEARRWFTELMEEDPEGEWAENAGWMLENMEKDDAEILQELSERIQAPGQQTPPPIGGPPPPGFGP